MSAAPPPLRAMAVVIPAHNEETLLGPCLESVRVAVASVALPMVVVVVLDRCSDGSAAVARSHAPTLPLVVVEGRFTTVGAVRDAGVTHVRRWSGGLPGGSVWVANTDADSLVPARWLAKQRALADSGVDLVLGTVEPQLEAHDRIRALWHMRHHLREDHDHVHGANLGIRLAELDRVGGFGGARVGEDVDVAARVRSAQGRWLATDTTRVVTSARRQGRVADGFAAYLRQLDATLVGADGDSADRACLSS